MTTEAIKYLIDAEDRATAKVRASKEAIEAQVKTVQNTGRKAKASTEAVGALAVVLGNSGVGAFAGEVSMLTDRMSAMGDMADQSRLSLLAFKAALAAGVGVVAFKAANAIGQLVFQTERHREALTLHQAEFDKNSEKVLSALDARIARQKKLIELTVDQTDKEQQMQRWLAQHMKEIQGPTGTGGLLQAIRIRKQAIEEMENRPKMLRTENFTAQIAHEKQNLAFLEAQLEARRQMVKELQQVPDLEMEAAEQRKKAFDATQKTATALEMQIIKLRDGKAAANAFGLELQGIGPKAAQSLARIQSRINDLAKPKKFSITPTLSQTDQRLLSGRGQSRREQLSLLDQARANNKVSVEQKRLLEKMLGELKKLTSATPVQTPTVGD